MVLIIPSKSENLQNFEWVFVVNIQKSIITLSQQHLVVLYDNFNISYRFISKVPSFIYEFIVNQITMYPEFDYIHDERNESAAYHRIV